MRELKKIDVMSLAKLQAIVMAFFGLIAGIFAAIFGGAIGALAGTMGIGAVGSMGLLSIVVMPITYAIMGFIGGALFAILYNLVAGWIGGVQLEL